MKDLTIGPQNYTQDNLIDHLQRHAYHGVSLGSTWGSDFGDMPFHVRDTCVSRMRRGSSRLAAASRRRAKGTPENMRQAAHVCATPDDCRRGVRENAARKLGLVKIWVQDRPAGIPKMSPELYRATIDEAHKHKMKVVVHATALPTSRTCCAPASTALRTFPTAVDDELMAIVEGPA